MKKAIKTEDAITAEVRRIIEANDAKERADLAKTQRDSLEERIAAKSAVLREMISGKSTESDIPEQDSGKALVGRWCRLWDGKASNEMGYAFLVEGYDENEAEPSYFCEGLSYRHACPIEREPKATP